MRKEEKGKVWEVSHPWLGLAPQGAWGSLPGKILPPHLVLSWLATKGWGILADAG